MPCPFFEKSERMFVSCYCPGMEYRIIQHFTYRQDKEIQLQYCKGTYKTARYCPLYGAIEHIIQRPHDMTPTRKKYARQIGMVRNGRFYPSPEIMELATGKARR